MRELLFGFAIAVWFARTSGRLGHGIVRAACWSIVGFALFLLPYFLLPPADRIRDFLALDNATQSWIRRGIDLAMSLLPGLIGIALAALVRAKALR